METLDPAGKLLYDSYINARDAWISYIKPQALAKLNNYLSSTGRAYYKYQYYTDTTHGYMQNKAKTPDMVSKYKKLCILFHPDKFKHSSSSELFCLLKKLFDSDNASILDMLESISHFILELSPDDTLSTQNILLNISNPNILDIIRSKCPDINDSSSLYDLLTTEPSKLSSYTTSNNSYNSSCNMSSEDFINTNAYKFFMDEATTKTEIEKIALTEEELIEYIKLKGKYDEGFLTYYMERYRDNKNILQAIVEIQLQRNEELKKENQRMRAALQY